MLEEFRSLYARDFRARYNHSYGYFTTTEKRRVLVWVMGVNDNGDEVEFIDANQVRYKALADTGVEFEFIPVMKRLFEHDKVLKLAQRHTARQWARGVNNANTRITRPATGRAENLTFGNIIAAFEKEPQNIRDKVLALEKRETNVIVFSDAFGVEDSSLYVYDEVVGQFLADRREILLDEPMFRQEVVDLVTKHALPYKVVSNG